jgi:hypothetical protein
MAAPLLTKGGYELNTCDSSDRKQLFLRKGPETPLSKDFSAEKGYDYLSLVQGYKEGEKSVVECMTVLTDTMNVWKVGARVARAHCSRNTDGSANNTWKFKRAPGKDFVTQIAVPNGDLCVTANSSLGTGLFLGQCSQPASLTQWHFEIVIQ